MKFASGTYVGTGVPYLLNLGFDLGRRATGRLYVKANAATAMQWYAEVRGVPLLWCGRSNSMIGEESYNDGMRFTERGVLVGADSKVNAAGTTYYWFFIGDSGDEDFDMTSYLGNSSPTLGRDVEFRVRKTIVYGEIKRDSNLNACIFCQAGATTTTAESGGALGANNFIDALAAGCVTVKGGYASPQLRVNQLNGTSGQLGEGHEAFVIFQSPDVRVTTYTSDGVAGREITIADESNPAKACFVFRIASGGGSMRLKTAEMTGSNMAPATAAALQVNDGSLSADGTKLVVGSTASAINGAGAGITFVCVAFLASGFAKTMLQAPAIRIKKRQAVRLDGLSTSAIDCGTSDATLKFDGAGTWQWAGVVQALVPGGSGTYEIPFIMRSNSYNAVGSTSWGIGALRQSTGKAWGGPFFQPVVTTRFANSLADCRDIWRTGLLVPVQTPIVITQTHDGSGYHEFWLNGRLMKQRDLDLTITPLWGGNGGAVTGAPEDIAAYPGGAPNIQSGVAHKTCIGARWNGSAFSASLKGLVYEAQVHNVQLTHDEVVQEHERILYDTGTNVVTRGIVERWDADRAGANKMPASYNSVNDGTITGGGVIVL